MINRHDACSTDPYKLCVRQTNEKESKKRWILYRNSCNQRLKRQSTSKKTNTWVNTPGNTVQGGFFQTDL